MSAETIGIRRPVRAARYPGLAAAGRAARGATRGALIWGAVFGLMVWELVSQSGNEYPTTAARAMLTKTMGSDVGLQAIFGMAHHIDTVAGYTAYHALGVPGLIGAIWGLLAATRLTRGEEEAGRWELLLAGHTTRRRAAAAAMAGLGAGLLILWAVTAAVTIAAGRSYGAHFSVTASLFTAVAATAATAVFMAVGALCSQLSGTRRQAAAMAAAVFGVACLIRLIGYTSTSLMWLRWASPLGLAARLARRSALSWLGGLAAGGLILGLTAKGTETVFSSQSGGALQKLGGASGGACSPGRSPGCPGWQAGSRCR